MKARLGVSLDPAHYAWQLVARLGFKEPAISDQAVLDYLRLERRYFQWSHFFSREVPEDEDTAGGMCELPLFAGRPSAQSGGPPKRKPPDAIDAFLRGNTVWVNCEFPQQRQRFATCHEVAHFFLPWHEGLTYVNEEGCVIEPPGALQYELEASRFAADLLMPPPLFKEDMDSLPFGLESIEYLSTRYFTSLEATARHYVDLSSSSCALVIVEALPRGTTTLNEAQLRVRYCHKSRSFNHFIRPGTQIASKSPIAQASLKRSSLTIADEVPGWVLGLRPERRLTLHCRAWGKEGDVLVLVEEPQKNQSRLF